MNFPILLHSNFYKRLRESDPGFRDRVRKTLARLHDGIWGGGTRVKRLAGVPSAIYEARIDAGNRLIFTAAKSADRDWPQRLTTHLQVWDAVHHDEVSRVAGRRNRAPDAEFLQFPAVEHYDIDEPPPHPTALFEDLPNGDGEHLLHFLIPPDHFQPRDVEGIAGATRWYWAAPFMLSDDTEFQRIMDAGGAELELKLVRDQYEILRSPGPVLLAGSAGSGKTTIAVHRLAEAASHASPLRSLYLSYSSWLVDHARNLYRGVMLAKSHDPTIHAPDFFSFNDLYRKFVPSPAGVNRGRPINRDTFLAWLQKSGLKLDGALVWEELRSILKGACLKLGQPMLDEKDYYELGRKRAPLFVAERPELYRIAQRYQQWLADNNTFDQIDLCRQAFRELRHGRTKKYDLIVCDEVQDLTELEITFVLSLVSGESLSGLMLAGDMQQIVNPSGFRWAEVRQAVMRVSGRHAKAPALSRLRKNFRSVRPLVELANTILRIKREVFGRTDEDDLEEAVVEGPIPVQVMDEEDRVLREIQDFGPRCAVVVPDEAERDRLAQKLDTTRIFHIQDVKGLEFESVILWKILQPAASYLERFLRNSASMEREAQFKQLLQHLYVALTRARRHLAVFEGPEAHAFWNDSRFRGRFEIESAGALPRVFRESASPEDWSKEAEYYAERRRYRQSAECYRRAGLVDKENEAHALFYESIDDWDGALKRWEILGEPERQAPLLVRLGRLSDAIEIYKQLGQSSKVQELQVRMLEKQGQWAEAGQQWEQLGQIEDALRCYKKSGSRARSLAVEAGLAESRADWPAAARYWLEIESFDRAAQCFKKAKDRKNAALAEARHYEKAKEWSKATAAFRRAGDSQKSNECRAIGFELAGKFSEAACLREKLGQPQAALRLHKQAGNQRAVDRLEFQMIDLGQAQGNRVRTLFQRGQFQRAFQLAKSRLAILRKRLPYGASTRWNGGSQLLIEELNQLEYYEACSAAHLAEHAKHWNKAAGHWKRAGEYEKADKAEYRAITSISDPSEQGKAWLRWHDFEAAIECYTRAGNTAGVGEAMARRCEGNSDWTTAAQYWASIGRNKEQARCMAKFSRQQQDWAEAAHWHRLGGQESMALVAEKKAKQVEAARRPRPVQEELF